MTEERRMSVCPVKCWCLTSEEMLAEVKCCAISCHWLFLSPMRFYHLMQKPVIFVLFWSTGYESSFPPAVPPVHMHMHRLRDPAFHPTHPIKMCLCEENGSQLRGRVALCSMKGTGQTKSGEDRQMDSWREGVEF